MNNNLEDDNINESEIEKKAAKILEKKRKGKKIKRKDEK